MGDRFHQIFMEVVPEAGLYHFDMTHLRSTAASRTLTVVLSESDWQAFRAIEPDAVGWLHERIRERLGAAAQVETKPTSGFPATAATAGSVWGDDEY